MKKVLVVLDYPTMQMKLEGRFIYTPEINIVKKSILYAEQHSEIDFIFAVPDKINKTEITNYKSKLLKHIEQKNSDVILALGYYPNLLLIGKGNALIKQAGKVKYINNIPVIISYGLDYIEEKHITDKAIYNPTTIADVSWKTIIKQLFLVLNNKDKINTVNYKEATEEDIKDILTANKVAIDYETTGLSPYNSKVNILSLSFSIEQGKSRIIVFDGDVENKIQQVKSILTNPKIIKIVANRPFEELFTKVKFNFDIKGAIHDVLTMAHIINEKNSKPYSLEAVTNTYSNLLFIKEVSENKRDALSLNERDLLIRYNGVDTDATLRVYNVLLKLLKQEPMLLNYYKYFMYPIQTMYADIESRGVLIDTLKFKQNYIELSLKIDNLTNKCFDLLPKSILNKYADNLKLTRSAITSDYLFEHKDGLRFTPKIKTEKTNKPQITEKHLQSFKNKSKYVEHYLEAMKVSKIRNTYFKQIKESLISNHINKEDKVYPHTLLMATDTGRFVIKNPALQTIPQRGSDYVKYIKELFIAPEGYYLIDTDLGQSELRIMGWISKCKGIMTAMKKDIDLHKATANMVLNIPFNEITKEQRQSCKAINFGFIYGAQAKTFQQIAKNDYGIIFTLDEATKLRDKFFKAYPEIIQWHKDTINFARINGYVESPLGRREHLPYINAEDFKYKSMSERQAINFPIQSLSSDINAIRHLLLENYLKEHNLIDKAYTLFAIHDAIFAYVKKDFIKEFNDIVIEITQVKTKEYIKDKFKVDLDYPITLDLEYGENWNDLKEYKEVI